MKESKAVIKNVKLEKGYMEVASMHGVDRLKGIWITGELSVPEHPQFPKFNVIPGGYNREYWEEPGVHNVDWFYQVASEGEALFLLQKNIETTDYKDVIETSTWIAKDQYDREIVCDTEEEAQEAHKRFGYPRKVSSFSEPLINQRIINLTQHTATSEQVEDGVIEPAEKGAVQAALTFDAIPTASEMAERAELIARISVDSGCNKAMIGGAPFFMSALEKALLSAGITPVYAFSVRESIERTDKEGNVIKTNVFKHVGFVEIQ